MYDRKGNLYDNAYGKNERLYRQKVANTNTLLYKSLIDFVFIKGCAKEIKALKRILLHGEYFCGHYSVIDLFYIHNIDRPKDNGYRLGCQDISDEVKEYMSHRLSQMGHWLRFKVWLN